MFRFFMVWPLLVLFIQFFVFANTAEKLKLDLEQVHIFDADLWTFRFSNNLNRNTTAVYLAVRDPKYKSYQNDEFQREDMVTITHDLLKKLIQEKCVVRSTSRIEMKTQFKDYDFGGQFFKFVTPKTVELQLITALVSDKLGTDVIPMDFLNAENFQNIPMEKRLAKEFLDSRRIKGDAEGNSKTNNFDRSVYISIVFKLTKVTNNESTALFTSVIDKVYIFKDQHKKDLIAVLTGNGAIMPNEGSKETLTLTESPYNVRSLMPKGMKWKYLVQYTDENNDVKDIEFGVDRPKVFIPETITIDYMERSTNNLGAKGAPDFRTTKDSLIVLWTTKKMLLTVFKVTILKKTPENEQLFKNSSDEDLLAYVKSIDQ